MKLITKKDESQLKIYAGLIKHHESLLKEARKYLKDLKAGKSLTGLPMYGEGDSLSQEIDGTEESIKDLKRIIKHNIKCYERQLA